MAGWPPAKNAAFTWYFVIRDADGDLVASATALDVEFSVDGGVFADVAGTEVDEGQGFYSCPISAAEMNGDAIMLMCKTSTAGAKTAAQIIYTSTRQIDDLAFPTVSGRSLDVTATGAAGIDFGNIEGTLAAAAIATGAITAAKFAAGAIDAAALAADAVDEIWDEAMVEPAQGIPSATPAFRTLLAYLYTALRNAITVSSTELTFSNDAGTVTFKKALSDTGSVYTEAEAVSGP